MRIVLDAMGSDDCPEPEVQAAVEVARAAVQELVGLHAPTWCDEALFEIDWLGAPSEAALQLGRTLYEAQLPAFLDRFAAQLAPDEVAIIERVAQSKKGPPFVPPGDVFSVVHIDYRLDNLLIDESQTPPRITAVDWQSLSIGHPLSDVAYFLDISFIPV